MSTDKGTETVEKRLCPACYGRKWVPQDSVISSQSGVSLHHSAGVKDCTLCDDDGLVEESVALAWLEEPSPSANSIHYTAGSEPWHYSPPGS